MKPGPIAALGAAVVLGWMAVFVGEYSTFDWLNLRRQVAEELGDVAHYPGRHLYGL